LRLGFTFSVKEDKDMGDRDNWEVKRRGERTPYIVGTVFRWRIKSNKNTVAWVRTEKDASLIAAAPQMYELLKQIKAQTGWLYKKDVIALRQVLAKADGLTPPNKEES
jgi:hypothetical protein